MKVSIQTLGCKVNQFDAGVLKDRLETCGMEIAKKGEEADAHVIFTCTVTRKSDYQCRQAIRRAVREKGEGGLVIVTGCYAQTNPEEISKIAGVDMVMGNEARESIAEVIAGNFGKSGISPAGPVQAIAGRSRAFLKVQEGCGAWCSYCIVPMARGVPRSAGLDGVLARADELIGRGYHEIVLTGVHLGAYRGGPGGEVRLPGLVRRLLERPGLGRLRISSIEPMEVEGELAELAGSEKLCRHFHIPLQSANDSVLESMKRGYTAVEYFGVVERLSRKVPGACIGADVMVGYPVEEPGFFEETLKRIEDSPLNHLHVFSFSPRPGTRAAALGDPVPPEVKKERSLRLRELAAKKNTGFRRGFIGETLSVVVEDKGGAMSGLTDNYIRVRFDGHGLRPGSEVTVRITGATEINTEGVAL